jgi:hypothetical protein
MERPFLALIEADDPIGNAICDFLVDGRTPPSAEVEAALLSAVSSDRAVLLDVLRWFGETSLGFQGWLPPWLLRFVLEALPPPLWCDAEVLAPLLELGAGSFSFSYDCVHAACREVPALRDSEALLEAVLARGNLHVVDAFSDGLLLRSKERLVRACRETWEDWPSEGETKGLLELLPLAYSRDRDFLLRAGRHFKDLNLSWRSLSPRFLADRAVVLEFLQGEGRLRDAAPELRADRAVVEAAVARHGGCLSLASPELQEDPELLLLAASSDPDFFEGAAGGRHLDSLELAETVLRQEEWRRPVVMSRVSERLRGLPRLVLMAFDKRRTRALSRLFGERRDPSLDCWAEGLLLHLRQEWAAVRPSVKEDAAFQRRLVEQSGHCLLLLAEEGRADRELVLAAVRDDATALCHAAPAVWRRDEGLLGFCAELLAESSGRCWPRLPEEARSATGLERHECRVCCELPVKRQMRQCANGHALCVACAQRLSSKEAPDFTLPPCPFCRRKTWGKPYGARCLTAEEWLESDLDALRAAPKRRRLQDAA